MNSTDLPCVLVEHFVEAARADDGDRFSRILGKAGRAGADLVPELAATLEIVRDRPSLTGAVMLLAAATKCPSGRALALRCFALSEDVQTSLEVEETCEQDPAGWAEAALLLLPTAERDEDRDVSMVCIRALACAEPGTPGVLDALVGQLGAHPNEAAQALAQHHDPAAGPALLEWFRALPHTKALSPDGGAAASNVGTALAKWDVLDSADMQRLVPIMARKRTRLTSLADRLARDADRLTRPHKAPRARSADRMETGPNAPCPCGSGNKTKRCCG
jgi:hypothetical protein